MEDRETARMRKYGESKTTRIMMATVPHVTSGLGLRKFQVDGFLLTRVYIPDYIKYMNVLNCKNCNITAWKRSSEACMKLTSAENTVENS